MADWPKKEDSLHKGGPWIAEGILGAFPSPDGNSYYATAYKEAADELVSAVLDGRMSVDFAVYPVIYLYRHYIELMLKDIIDSASELKECTENHKIAELWKAVRPLLESAFPDGKEEDTDAVEKCVLELAAIDPSGEYFRYAHKKIKQGGGTNWPKTVQINLSNMRDVMNGIAGFLEGSGEALHDLEQNVE